MSDISKCFPLNSEKDLQKFEEHYSDGALLNNGLVVDEEAPRLNPPRIDTNYIAFNYGTSERKAKEFTESLFADKPGYFSNASNT